MDYTKFPRQLIYRDRTDMNEFDVEKTGTSDGWFLDNLKKRPFILKTEKAADYALRIFNDAHYICTLFFLHDQCFCSYTPPQFETYDPEQLLIIRLSQYQP